MSNFLTGTDLENKLTDIIWNAKRHLILISPYVQLDDYCKTVFDKLTHKDEVHIILIFGKNEKEANKSLDYVDFEFFKKFKKITVCYNKNLHAKFYSNETDALMTSLNLYHYSMVNNIELGIHFTYTPLNPIDKLYQDAYVLIDNIIDNSICVFARRPIYKKQYLGLSKQYIDSKIIFDQTELLYSGRKLQRKFISDFEGYSKYDDEMKKPTRDQLIYNVSNSNYSQKTDNSGYCIRTGIKIPFNPERPFCKDAFYEWNQYKNYYYPENFCHKTGKKSNGNTSMENPIL